MPSPSKTSLSASKVAELKALCSKHGLPVSGNKGELVNRLMAYFEGIQTSATPGLIPSKNLTSSSNPSVPTSNPSGITSTNSISEPAPAQTNQPAQSALQSGVPTTSNHNANHTINHPVTPAINDAQPKTVEDEIEKRKQRAQRFGLEVQSTPVKLTTDEEELKKSLRAKRFGVTAPVDMNLEALDKPLADGKDAKLAVKSLADAEWEARKRKRAEKFGLVDNPPSSTQNDRRKSQKFNHPPSRY